VEVLRVTGSSDSFSVRELPDLPANERLGECARCGDEPGSERLVQLRAIGHHVALCGRCLYRLAELVEPTPEPFAGKTIDAWLP
jgi:hypothetical protein